MKKILKSLYVVAILSVGLITETLAQKNWLDESFGRKGILRYDDLTLTKDFDEAAAVYLEDKLLLLGIDTSNRANGFTLVRLKNDGSPDYSFIPRRIIETDSTDYFSQILVTPDKKIVLFGMKNKALHEYEHTILKFNQNGLADQGFGNKGLVTIPRDKNYIEQLQSAIIQSDGKIVFAITSMDLRTTYDAELKPNKITFFRLNIDGSNDGSFGNGGPVSYAISYINPELSMNLQPDGKILVGGAYTKNWSTNSAAITQIRLNADGSLDKSFANNGAIEISYHDLGIDTTSSKVRFVQNPVFLDDNQMIYTLTECPNIGSYSDCVSKIYRLKSDGTPDFDFQINYDEVSTLPYADYGYSKTSDNNLLLKDEFGFRKIKLDPSKISIVANIQNEQKFLFRPFPNPSNGNFAIENAMSVQQVVLTNSLGQIETFDDASNIQTQMKGLLFATVKTSNGSYSFKVEVF
ncbi:delta-60 repeat domain-containing protein [Sporocytophaga myxococcoides]|uniref:delta-60 repeat domain-containing protein n=1 Tax=Sporocytophaga myxococcoides TaxID=153721 RepID=UPI000419C54A|nr:delta-60 repeat domain-containing protein [Sporocytophaga myxococcoides]